MITHTEMIEVRVSGWQVGARKVSAVDAIRRQSSLGLEQAKSVVDQCLDGKESSIRFESADPALRLAKELIELGFISSVWKCDPAECLWSTVAYSAP